MNMKVLTRGYGPSPEDKEPEQLELNFEQYADPAPQQPLNDAEAARAASHQEPENWR